MKLRILHVLDHSLPLHSGYTFRTLSILREQHRLGWDTVQLTTPKHGAGPATLETVDDLLFHRTPSSASDGFITQMRLTARRLDALIAETQPDVVHAHSPVLNALPSLWVRRKRCIPVVYEMRAAWEDAAVDHGTTTEGSVRYRLTRAMETFALRHVDQVTTICEGLCGDIVARGIDSQRITVIPNAVNATTFQFGVQPDLALRKSLELDGATVLGFAGSFYGYEGLDLLIEAVRRMSVRRPDIRVLLVGGGPQEERLRQQVKQAGLQDRVIFTGRVPHDQVQRYYGLIDVLAYPRLPMRLTELVTPLKPLEAMAQGRIFVASDVGGHRELVRHGETGFLFRAGDAGALEEAIEAVLAQRASWPSILAQARHFVEVERTWAISVARYQSVYSKALGREVAIDVAS